MQPVRPLTVSPNLGYYTQQNMVTLSGSGFIPEYDTLLVRLVSRPLMVEYYVWPWEEIYFVNSETLVVRMPPLPEIGEADYADVIFQVSINSGVSWSLETPQYFYEEEPSLNALSHYESPTRGHFTLTVFGHAFSDRIKWCYFDSVASQGKSPTLAS